MFSATGGREIFSRPQTRHEDRRSSLPLIIDIPHAVSGSLQDGCDFLQDVSRPNLAVQQLLNASIAS
jgi:hypothetical protein